MYSFVFWSDASFLIRKVCERICKFFKTYCMRVIDRSTAISGKIPLCCNSIQILELAVFGARKRAIAKLNRSTVWKNWVWVLTPEYIYLVSFRLSELNVTVVLYLVLWVQSAIGISFGMWLVNELGNVLVLFVLQSLLTLSYKWWHIAWGVNTFIFFSFSCLI